MTPTDPRAPSLERTVEAAIRIGLVAAMIALCFWIVKPFLVPIAWGIIIAVAAWPGYRPLLDLVHGRRTLASVLFVLIAALVLIVPILMLSGTVIDGGRALTHGLQGGGFKVPPAPDLSGIPLVGGSIQAFWQNASSNLDEALRTIEPQLQMLGHWLLHFAEDAGVGILHFILAILIAAVLLARSDTGQRVTEALAARLAGARGRDFAKLAESVVRSVSRGILGVALIQSVLAGIGMLAAGVPAAGLWALLVLLLSTIQLGAGLVMLPVALWLFHSASLTTAILFAIWAVFVTSLDSVLKPILLGRGVPVPMAVIFVGAIGGFIGAGIIGLFVGSVVLALGYELFLAWLGMPVSELAGGEPKTAADLDPTDGAGAA